MLSRHQIGIAQGILMATYGLTVDQAFDVLRRYSSHRNIKLREVAEQVVRAVGMPDETDRRRPGDRTRPRAPDRGGGPRDPRHDTDPRRVPVRHERDLRSPIRPSGSRSPMSASS